MATDPSMDNSISAVETLLRRQASFNTSVETPRMQSGGSHTIECCCSRCERDGSGYFAQQAALAGDLHAAKGLTLTVAAALAACAPCIVTAQAEQTPRPPKCSRASASGCVSSALRSEYRGKR